MVSSQTQHFMIQKLTIQSPGLTLKSEHELTYKHPFDDNKIMKSSDVYILERNLLLKIVDLRYENI